MLKKVGWHLVN